VDPKEKNLKKCGHKKPGRKNKKMRKRGHVSLKSQWIRVVPGKKISKNVATFLKVR